jgi:3-phenylpropionate/cinnamic acid dioxygenase small subunit
VVTVEEIAMNDDFKILLEKDAVIGVVNQLFIGTDNRDWEKVQACFANAVLFDMTSMTGGEPVTMTPQQIVDGWDQGLKALKVVHHQTGNCVVNIHNNEAEMFCYGIALHYLPNKTNQNTRTFVGSYDFHLAKSGNTWRIDKFKFNLKYIDGNANLEASQ